MGVEASRRDARHDRRFHVGGPLPQVDPGLRAEVMGQVADDVDRLRELLDDDLVEWTR